LTNSHDLVRIVELDQSDRATVFTLLVAVWECGKLSRSAAERSRSMICCSLLTYVVFMFSVGELSVISKC
jgi:hypothetical protein